MTLQAHLVKCLGTAVQPLGYRRRRANWFLCGPELYSIVNIQKSPWGDMCYVSIGISPAASIVERWRAESQCDVRVDVGALNSIETASLKLLDGTTRDAMNPGDWETAVNNQIALPVVGFLSTTTSFDTLSDALKNRTSGNIYISADARNLLRLDES